MCQPRYFFWCSTSRGLTHQENTLDGLQISKINRCPGYLRVSCSYSEAINTGATTHAYTNKSTGIDTGIVYVTLPFENVIAKPNGIRVKYPDRNTAQATHSALLKLPFLPAEAHHVHLFNTLALGLLLSLGKLYNTGCIAYFNATKVCIFFRVKLSSKDSDLPLVPYCGNLTKTITSTKKTNKFNHKTLSLIIHQ